MQIKINYSGYLSERNYADWIYVKDNIQAKKVLRTFKEWEIWWCAIGENVGTEINGKGVNFARPVIIFKKFNRFSFVSIPLTTKDHSKKFPDWCLHFNFQGKNEYAMINQIENTSVYRLYRKMGQLDDLDIRKIQNAFSKVYLKNTPS